MNKPRWTEPDFDFCQWPKCGGIGQVHYEQGSTKWISKEDGVWLCDKHQKMMHRELWPSVEPQVTVGDYVWLKSIADWPREQVFVRDWFFLDGNIFLLVSDVLETELEDCEEVPLSMLELSSGEEGV